MPCLLTEQTEECELHCIFILNFKATLQFGERLVCLTFLPPPTLRHGAEHLFWVDASFSISCHVAVNIDSVMDDSQIWINPIPTIWKVWMALVEVSA